jgi:hypothetical protein
MRFAYEAGANAYHVKPQDFGEFVAVIKRIGEFWLMGGSVERGSKGKFRLQSAPERLL